MNHAYVDSHLVGKHDSLNPKWGKGCQTKEVLFLEKSYGEWNKVKKPAVVEGEFKMVSAHDENNNYCYNIVRYLESYDEIEENVFDEQINY